MCIQGKRPGQEVMPFLSAGVVSPWKAFVLFFLDIFGVLKRKQNDTASTPTGRKSHLINTASESLKILPNCIRDVFNRWTELYPETSMAWSNGSPGGLEFI